MPGSKCSGVVGLDGTLNAISVVPEHTPLIEIESPDCTSEKCIFPPLLTLCMLIKVPNLNKDAVICPKPNLKTMPISTAVELAETAATNNDFDKALGFLLEVLEEIHLVCLDFVFAKYLSF